MPYVHILSKAGKRLECHCPLRIHNPTWACIASSFWWNKPPSLLRLLLWQGHCHYREFWVGNCNEIQGTLETLLKHKGTIRAFLIVSQVPKNHTQAKSAYSLVCFFDHCIKKLLRNEFTVVCTLYVTFTSIVIQQKELNMPIGQHAWALSAVTSNKYHLSME